MKTRLKIFTTLILIIFWQQTFSQFIIDAGSDKYICVDAFGVFDTCLLDGEIISGIGSYTCSWECNYQTGSTSFYASYFLDDTTKLKPSIAHGDVSHLTFYLTVTDSLGNNYIDSVNVFFSHFSCLLTETESWIQQGDSVQIWNIIGGGIPPLTFAWSPNYNISDTTTENPIVWPDSTTVYNLTVTDSIGCISTFLEDWIVNVTPTIIKIIEKNNFTIYPNPAKNNVQLTMNNEQLVGSRIEIVNINGQTVKQITMYNEQCTINVEGLSKGIYFVKLIGEKGVSAQKLLVE
jgi:hypothetical protein